MDGAEVGAVSVAGATEGFVLDGLWVGHHRRGGAYPAGAFVQLIRLLTEAPNAGRAIAATHYCYYLVLCSLAGGATYDTETELLGWFRKDGPGALQPHLASATGQAKVFEMSGLLRPGT